MTTLAGTAGYLSQNRDLWRGTVVFVGQPAEERGSGANAMLDDGLFERFPKPEACLALHVSPNLPAGQIGIRPGYIMANVDSVDIKFHGVGGHGAYPHTTIDPIVQAARFVVDVQTMVSREVDPRDPAVITVGSIHAGTKHNIIPDQCHLQLTVRSYSESVREQLLDGIRRKARATADSSSAPEPTVTVSEGTPSLYNDDELTARLGSALAAKLGDGVVASVPVVMAGEDFSQYSRRGEIPGMLFWLGTVDQARLDRYAEMGIPVPGLHSAEFWPDPEPSLKLGISAMAWAALDLLGKP
jgi:hippurate hydrolase